MVDLSRRSLMKSSVAAAVGAGVTGVASGQSEKDRDGREINDGDTLTEGAPSVVGDLKRFSTTVFGAEMTGPFVFADGSLLHSIQHPDTRNPAPFNKGGIGYYKNFQFEFDGDNDDFAESEPPEGEEQDTVKAADTDFEVLIQEGDEINGGEERWGITQTPDGTDVTTENFAGSTYGRSGSNPDCNQFVATNDDGTDGYMFTNDENSPGNIARTRLTQTEDGEWEADPDDTINLPNLPQFRAIGGTRINCYGDLSPWDTPISSEEHYAHPRGNLTSTVSEIVEAGSGEGLRGGAYFWNRPNPVGIQDAVSNYSEVDAWYVQGYWNLDGVEHLAYHLGADPVEAGNGNPIEPIDDTYPNPYRYGYHVDIRNPTAAPEDVNPIKYYVMGRASWEAPDILPDQRTVYGCSDGDSKGIYKFVADEPVPSYDDPMDVEGTLYAPKITNDAASSGQSPADVPLDVEWLPLGHATNGEVAGWIADYDDITQADYLASHSDWSEGDEVTEEALKQADLEVIENGNQDLISDADIVEWARQYEENGPDGVDEELRRVPFLETREAATEIGASIEFNKAEGIDSMDDAKPGDFIYFGISEFNDDLAGPTNDQGDIALDRVDGGVVYRAELESDYNVSRLEPVIVGPDFTGEEAMADVDDALRNVDNVYAMRDGRVLCTEDGWRGGNRSYPNDGLFVYQPPVDVDVESAAVSQGSTAEVDVTASSLPAGLSGARVVISTSDDGVAKITGGSYNDALGLTADPVVSDESQTVELRFADTENNVQSGAQNVTIGTLEVEAIGSGTTDLQVSVENMDAENGSEIDAQERMGMVVTGPPALGSGSAGSAPTDPDGDGQFEDVNGNGRMDYADIELLFENLDDESVTMNVGAYDFNENGQIDYDDVVDLYEEQ
ncbi:alkaline phosphatase PhoX [Halorientalis sp.]|uniref:alkaline phosphatase PhoX n=1 Tax=Halorientalis sp. TaxID=1931229 RepID=UPI0032C219DC